MNHAAIVRSLEGHRDLLSNRQRVFDRDGAEPETIRQGRPATNSRTSACTGPSSSTP